MKIVLASNSPRRKELLEQAHFRFEVEPAKVEEVFDESLPIDEALMKVAQTKAMDVADVYPDYVVIGADTIVYFQGKRLGKPKNKNEAKRCLHALSNQTHEVKTGVCIIKDHQCYPFVETTKVHFRDVSNDEINRYVNSGSCMDKAGAYGIQECDFVEWIDGSYSNVVGLPMERICQFFHVRF
ncbi:Maf family protein [Absicoccus intestinalis]|uniref:dTTP/UTP pyrophosphatase n=1 Tax=Absicoccus intestinalis TaxID=2926319 RepID=A0ABU4WK14_9FIRM|nr:Maf family protein [Absicoccus sp. CLA-KB-P134]MDX8416902.1 Maf family protein [Absicoccus sp. CLA-KB-P134]